MLLPPKAIERVLVLDELNIPVVNVNPFKVIVPFVNVVVSVTPVFNALPKLQLPPTPLNVIAPFIVTPLVVIVLAVVAVNVIVPVLLQTVPAIVDQLPETVSVGVVPVANVTTPADTVIFAHASAPVIVTVYVPAWSKKTLSAAVGTLAPPDPFDDVDQFVVLVVFHVPAPPRQYLSAIDYSSTIGAAIKFNQLLYLSSCNCKICSGVVLLYSS